MDSELVTGVDGEPVDIIMTAEQTPAVDPRILGTYDGDGSMVRVDKTHSMEFGISGSIFMGVFTMLILFIVICVPQLILSSNFDSGQFWQIIIFSVASGLIATIIVSMTCRHFIAARLRYGASQAEAAYWQANKQLRMNGRTPHSQAEFKALLQLAQEADIELAPAYVAERTSKYFARLVDERGLWRQKASSAWLGPIVLQGIMDAQRPGNDPDDEPYDDPDLLDNPSERE